MAAKEQAVYSHGHHASVVRSHGRRTAQNSMAFVLPHLKPTDHVLDLGCGPATITADIAALVPQGKVIGGEPVQDILNQATELAKARGLTNLSFQIMDGNALPFEDNTFDAVLAHQVLQHVKAPIAVLREMRRVVKPGGFVGARDADYKSFAWYPEPPELDKWGQIYQEVAIVNGGQPNAGRYLHAWARDAGFKRNDVTYTWSTWQYDSEEATVWGNNWRDRVLYSGFGATAKERAFATEAELEAVSKAWEKWGTEPDAFIRIPNGEILCRKSA